MTSELVFTPAQISHRVLCATLKGMAKESMLAIRKHNETKGKDRTGYWQSERATIKATARARHLVYGFVRGHTLDRMERENSKPLSKWLLQKAWNDARAQATKEFADFDYTNDLLAQYVK